MDILKVFDSSLHQSLREEKKRAYDWKKATKNIPIAHLICDCGEPVKEKLLYNLLIASSPLFENFMLYFFKQELAKSQEKVAAIRATAKVRGVHPAVVLLQDLSEIKPTMTVKDLIDGLEYAHLYRVISQFEALPMKVLSEHAASHRQRGCCKAFSRSTAIHQGVTTGVNIHRTPQVTHSHTGVLTSTTSLNLTKATRGIILLTFVEDGRNHAMQVKEMLEKPAGKGRLAYTVYTLSDFGQLLVEDYVKNTLWILRMVDFVVPILTDGYIEMFDLSETNSSSIDEKYALHVARILLDDWAFSFKNRMMRCYRPKNVKWVAKNKLVYPPFLTAVNDLTHLPTLLVKQKTS